MFGIGPLELVVVAIVAIVVIGPERLPEVMKKFGRLFVQVRRQTHEIRTGFNEVVRDAERDLELERIKELKAQVDEFRSKASIGEKLKEEIDIKAEDIKVDLRQKPADKSDSKDTDSDSQYHESHYVDGQYQNFDEGYIDAEQLFAQAKEISDKVLYPKKDQHADSEESKEPPVEDPEPRTQEPKAPKED